MAIVAGIFGLFIGSFLNVVNLRFGKWKSIATTRSRCPKCKHTLNWMDLIPVLSFCLLGGRCHYCKRKISIQYPIIELVSAISTGLIWYHFNPTNAYQIIAAIVVSVFVYIFLLMSIEDSKQMLVHDQLFWGALLAGLLFVIFERVSFFSAVVGIMAAAGILVTLVIVSREQWMGYGDVIAAVPVGMILGYPLALLWIMTGFWIGALYGLGLIILKLKKRTDPVPFLPILYTSFIITLVWGDKILNLLFQF